jgi:hypothetical protein
MSGPYVSPGTGGPFRPAPGRQIVAGESFTSLLPKPWSRTINTGIEIVIALTPDGEPMPTRRTLLFIVACSFIVPCSIGAAPAADAMATAFVSKIYDAYKGKSSKGYSIASEADLRRTFEPSLAALILKDQKDAAKRKDAPALEFDPFVDGQEWELSEFSIAVSDTPPGKAVATASFKNFGLPTKIVLNLVKTKSDWQIANITWQRDGNPETLRGLFKH